MAALMVVGSLVLTALTTVTAVFASQAAQDLSQTPPVVVELYTSQGCSSCPPADALMLELSKRQDIIALTLPIDYWDNLGWTDTFASPRHSARQRTYAQHLPNRRIYTPQMVVNGILDLVGSHKEDVLQAIAEQEAAPRPTIAINLNSRNGQLIITIEDAPPTLADRKASIWIAPYHSGPQTVAITKGENRGRTIDYANVVDGIIKVGAYTGAKVEVTHALHDIMAKKIDQCAVLVQDDETGAIIGAALINWTS